MAEVPTKTATRTPVNPATPDLLAISDQIVQEQCALPSSLFVMKVFSGQLCCQSEVLDAVPLLDRLNLLSQ